MVDEATMQACVLMLLTDEGRELTPYQCSQGKWTIGVGRNLEDNPLDSDEQQQLFGTVLGSYHRVLGHLIDEGITKDQAHWLLIRDIKTTQRMMLRTERLQAIHQSCSPQRWAALLNMAFQMGVGGLLAFRITLQHARKGNWAAAAHECLNSQWALQTPKRAWRVAEVLRTGELEVYR